MSSKLPSFAIVHGFAEGSLNSHQLRRALTAKHYREVSDLQSADIIIAHSAGCLLLPEQLADKLVILANPSLNPRIPVLAKAMVQKLWWDFLCCAQQGRLGAWAAKSVWNLWYMIVQPRYNWHMVLTTIKAKGELPRLGSGNIVVINSQHDPWAVLMQRREILSHISYAYITYPGSHDQIWVEPETYAGVVQSWYESFRHDTLA